MTDCTNMDRAAWAETAVQAFMRETGSDRDTAVSDLIADLCHLSEADGVDPMIAIKRGLSHHYAETHHERTATFYIRAVPDDPPKPTTEQRLEAVILNLSDKLANFPDDPEYRDLMRVAMGEPEPSEGGNDAG